MGRVRRCARTLLAVAVLAAFGVAGAGVASAQPLIVAAEPQSASAPLIIASERGWFAEEGLDVQIVHFHANRTMAMALAEGDVDVGLIALSSEAFSMAASHHLRIIAGVEQLDPDHPRYAWLVNTDLSADGLGALEQRENAVVGLAEPGSPARFLLNRRLETAAETVSYVTEGSNVALAAALSQGKVDAALLPAHLAADLEATGAAVVSEWAGDSEGPVSLSVLMTTAAQARLRPEAMHRFLRAYVRGVRAYHAMVLGVDPEAEGIAGAERAALLEVIAAGARRPATEVAAALPYLAPDGGLDADSLAEQLRWWQDQGECQSDIDVNTLIDLAALDGALASLAEDEAALAEAEAAEEAENAQMDAQAEVPIDATDATAAGGPQEPVAAE